MLEIVLPLSIIGKYTQLIQPIMKLTQCSDNKVVNDPQEKFAPSTLNGLTSLRNDLLPLVYLEFKGCRLMLPASTNARYGLLYDLLIIQVNIIMNCIDRILSNFAINNTNDVCSFYFTLFINNLVRWHQYYTTR